MNEQTKLLLTVVVVVGALLGLATIAGMRLVRGSKKASSSDVESRQPIDPSEPSQAYESSRLARISGMALGLIAVGVTAKYCAWGLMLDHPDLPYEAGAVFVVFSLVVAVVPACNPRFRSMIIGTLLGGLLAIAGFIVLAVSFMQLDLALLIVAQSALIATLASLCASALALVVAYATRMVIDGPKPIDPATRRIAPWAAGVVLLCIGYFSWHPPRDSQPYPDPDYHLQPSTWRGEMNYGKAYPFTLVIEHVESNGQFIGYMDWGSEYRLKIEGKAWGNHLVFEDTAFIHGSAETGLYDRKDVWIANNQMKGTDKNGKARLSASLVRN